MKKNGHGCVHGYYYAPTFLISPKVWELDPFLGQLKVQDEGLKISAILKVSGIIYIFTKLFNKLYMYYNFSFSTILIWLS